MSIKNHWAAPALGLGLVGLLTLGGDAQIVSHEAWTDDQAVTIAKDARFCSFLFPQFLKDRLPLKVTRQELYSDAGGQVQQIVLYSDLDSDLDAKFNVLSGRVPNAAAFVQEDRRGIPRRYIVFHPQFLAYLQSKTKTRWAAASVFAHELGHHLAGHTLLAHNQRHFELQADWYSGYVLNKMGATLDETQRVLRVRAFWSEEGPPKPDGSAGLTHPPSAERLAAITNGWHQAECEINGRDCLNEVDSKPFEPQFSPEEDTKGSGITPRWICKVQGEQLFVGEPKPESRSTGFPESKTDGTDGVLSVYWQRHAESRTVEVGQMMTATRGDVCRQTLRVDLGDGFVQEYCATLEIERRTGAQTGNIELRTGGAHAASVSPAGLCLPCQSSDGSNDAVCPNEL